MIKNLCILQFEGEESKNGSVLQYVCSIMYLRDIISLEMVKFTLASFSDITNNNNCISNVSHNKLATALEADDWKNSSVTWITEGRRWNVAECYQLHLQVDSYSADWIKVKICRSYFHCIFDTQIHSISDTLRLFLKYYSWLSLLPKWYSLSGGYDSRHFVQHW